jgi:hypothetical protein
MRQYPAMVQGFVNVVSFVHFNHIDIGIFLCFLELCLDHENIEYRRELYIDDQNNEMNLVAKYFI